MFYLELQRFPSDTYIYIYTPTLPLHSLYHRIDLLSLSPHGDSDLKTLFLVWKSDFRFLFTTYSSILPLSSSPKILLLWLESWSLFKLHWQMARGKEFRSSLQCERGIRKEERMVSPVGWWRFIKDPDRSDFEVRFSDDLLVMGFFLKCTINYYNVLVMVLVLVLIMVMGSYSICLNLKKAKHMHGVEFGRKVSLLNNLFVLRKCLKPLRDFCHLTIIIPC